MIRDDIAQERLAQVKEWAGQSRRSQQTEIGMSQAGGADCQTWRHLNGSPVTNPDTRVMAAVRGTAVHRWLEPMFEAAGWKVEQEVTYGGLVGHGDLYRDGIVEDTKTGDRAKCDALRNYGPGRDRRWQVHLYGAGYAAQGLPVETVRITMYATDSSDEVVVWEEPFSQEVADEAVAHVEWVASQVEPVGPRKPWTFCRDWCRWWDESGEVGCTGLRRELPEIDDEQARQAARTVADLGRVADDIKAAKAALEGWQGTVDDLTVTTVHRRGKPSPDMDAIKALFGDDVPTKPGRDSTYVVVR